MANTATTDISTERICLNPSQGVSVTGKLTADTAPGQVVVYVVATQSWTKADSGTAAHKGMQVGIVGYKKRVNQSTNALKTITDNWDVSEAEDKRAPIWISGFCVAYGIDNNAAIGVLTDVQVSATAGSLEIWDTSNHDQVSVGTIAADVADDDTRYIVGIGDFKNKIWGGQN